MYTYPRLSTFAIGLLYFSSIFSVSVPYPSPSCPHQALGQRFDYVIVGGGIAGLVLANRITEQSGVTVAVIEAGTFPEDVVGNETQVPGYAGYFNGGGAAIEWGFTTTPQSVGSLFSTTVIGGFRLNG